VTEANFGRDGSCFTEMVYQLTIIQNIVVNILRLQDPFEIKAWRIWILIMNPASLFKSFLNIRITSSANKNFDIIVNLELLFPSRQVSYIRENMLLRLISLKKSIHI
jgi:hypothetical protein